MSYEEGETFLSKDGVENRARFFGALEEVMRVLGAQFLGGSFSGCDRDRRGIVRDAAADVVDRVADDDDVASAEGVSFDSRRALDRDRRQRGAIGGVAAERAECEVAIERRRLELDARAALDVAGEEAEENVFARQENVEKCADAGKLAHTIARGVHGETVDVRVPQLR